jgi:sulfoacetaldehyde acetyltransferase
MDDKIASTTVKTRMTGSESALEALRMEGVTFMPGLVGSSFMDMLDITEKAGIRYLPCRVEATAGFMAQGYTRASGKAAICIAQNGPGVSNLVTAVRDAYLAHTPMVAITPSTSTAHVGTDAIQELDAMALFAPVVGYQVRAARPSRIGESIRTAFRAAYAMMRPAQVDIPRDYFFEDFEGEVLEPDRYRASRIGAGDEEDLVRAAKLLAAARSPVILAGMGVVWSDATNELARFAEQIATPVVTGYLHNDAFPASHPLSLGPVGYGGSKAAMNALSHADVILAIGTRISEWGALMPRYEIQAFPRDAALIQIDRNPIQIGRTVPFKVGIIGDAKAALVRLMALAKELGPAKRAGLEAVKKEVAEARAAWDRELAGWSSSDRTPISPRRALMEMAKAMPEDAIVATDIGNVIGVAGAYLKFESPRRHIAALGYGGCGPGLGLAMGARLAQPDAPVIALIGDGSWGYAMIDTLTAVQQNLPVTVVILDNSQWGAEKRNQVEFYSNRFVGTNLVNPDFAAIARTMGAEGIRVEKPADVGPAIAAAAKSDKTTIVHLLLDSNELGEAYRRDALKAPKRVHPRYRA